MKCPVCRIDMAVIEYKKIELDYCLKCAGVWFDAGELELLLEAAGVPGKHMGGLPTHSSSGEKKRKCPICGKKMDKATLGEKPKVLIDSCPQGDGIWFDGGELTQAVADLSPKPMEKTGAADVMSFLADVFKPEAKSVK